MAISKTLCHAVFISIPEHFQLCVLYQSLVIFITQMRKTRLSELQRFSQCNLVLNGDWISYLCLNTLTVFNFLSMKLDATMVQLKRENIIFLTLKCGNSEYDMKYPKLNSNCWMMNEEHKWQLCLLSPSPYVTNFSKSMTYVFHKVTTTTL